MAGRWRIASAACAVSIVLCIAFVDRPVAEYMQQHFYGDRLFAFASRALAQSVGVLFAALAVLIGAGIAAATGRRHAPWTRVLIQGSLAGVAALAVAVALKFAIGRSQVYPAYLVDRIYTLSPFRGEQLYAAFPSATTATAAAMLTVAWLRVPRLRVAWALALAGVAFAIIITNGHWLSDVIAGAFLGGWVGAAIATRAARSPPRYS